MSDSLQNRQRAMEDLFFKQQDQRLLDDYRKKIEDDKAMNSLSAATGIKSNDLLVKLVDSGISADSLTALSMIPLIVVAWADNEMADQEREAIKKAADESGLSSGSGLELVESWLSKKPEDELLATWSSYVGELKGTVDGAEFAEMKADIMGRARTVAEAAGGFLGLTSKISSAETEVLESLEASFG